MPSTIDIRRRIRSVKNTQQITKAMKMVAAAKLRRAQERMFAARPYAAGLRQVLASVATRVDISAHPLLQSREPERNVVGGRRHRRPRALPARSTPTSSARRRTSSASTGGEVRLHDRTKGGRLLQAPSDSDPSERLRGAGAVARGRARDRRRSDQRLHRREDRRRLRRVQRVQIDHRAARRRRAAPSDRARMGRGRNGSTTSTSRGRSRSSTSSCRSTSSFSSIASCSSRPPPNRARA